MQADLTAPADRRSGNTSQLLIAPSEWSVLCAVFAAKPPATTTAVMQAMGRHKLPQESVEALLWRLQQRKLISAAAGHTWTPGPASLQELLRLQFESFLLAYVADVPEGFACVQEMLKGWRRGTVEMSAEVEHG
jgi:hypothetical protein